MSAAEKCSHLDAFLLRGETGIMLDSRQPGVDVPNDLRRPDLILKLSYRYGEPLEIDGHGIFARLSFGGARHDVKIPWGAIYAMASVDGLVAAWEAPAEPIPLTKRRGQLGLVS